MNVSSNDIFWIKKAHLEDPSKLIGKTVNLVNIRNKIHCDVEIVEDDSYGFREIPKENQVNGKLFSGVVVRTKQVPAGEGLTTGVPKSDIIFKQEIFVAPDAETAKGIIIANALRLDAVLDFTSQVEQLEVKVFTHA